MVRKTFSVPICAKREALLQPSTTVALCCHLDGEPPLPFLPSYYQMLVLPTKRGCTRQNQSLNSQAQQWPYAVDPPLPVPHHIIVKKLVVGGKIF